MIELMRALHDLQSPTWTVNAGRNANALLARERGTPWYSQHVVESASRGGKRSPNLIWQNELRLRGRAMQTAGIVHRTYHPTLDLLPRSVSVIETLHDMWDFVATDERGARAALRRHLKRRALERADHIICVSRSTRDRLGNLWPKLADRSIVIPHGASRLSTRPMAVERSRPYFLFVGRRDRYKNFQLALDALALAPRDADLVCFGGGSFTAAEQHDIAARSLTGRLHQTGGHDDLLAGHYEGATALLYPSRHEGFGLPLLEAMSHDCPVIAAPLTSLPEVGGQAIFYAGADDPEAWANVMLLLLEDDEARTRAIDAGRARAAEFSWRDTAIQHVALYQDTQQR